MSVTTITTVRGFKITTAGYSSLKDGSRTVLLSDGPEMENMDCGLHLTADEAIDLACDLLREANEIRGWAKFAASVAASEVSDDR